MKKHVDHVALKWGALKEELIERLPADDPRAGKEGDYSYFSQPHTMSECPWTAGSPQSYHKPCE